MRALRTQGAAVRAIVERDLRVFVSYRGRTLSQVFGILLSISIFYYVSRMIEVGSFTSSDEYFAFVTTGLLTAFVLQSALSISLNVHHELVAGTFERLLLSPFGPIPSILSTAVFPIAFALFTAAVGLFGAVLVFDLPVVWSTAAAAIPVFVLGAVAFGAIGLLMTASVVLFKQAPGTAVILALISLTGGVYFPPDLLPEALRWLSEVQPFTPTIDLLRHLLIGTESSSTALASLLKLAGFIVVLVPLAMFTLRKSISAAQRRGTILEY